MASATTFFDFTPKDKKAADYPLSQHKGKVSSVLPLHFSATNMPLFS